MTGVEILSSTEVVVGSQFNWLVACITFGVILVIGIFLGVLTVINEDDWNFAFCIFGIMFITALFAAVPSGEIASTNTEYETQYKVTISDEVSMNDFLDRYEIINQEGKIYTVREKE